MSDLKMKSNFYRGLLSHSRKLIYGVTLLLCMSSNLYAVDPVEYITDDWENSRYIDNDDGTVTDTRTLLMWMQCSDGLITIFDEPCDMGAVMPYQWPDALAYAENYEFEGYEDWRLPNVKELQSLAAYNRSAPVINVTLFPNTESDDYWTSTIGTSVNEAWSIDFGDGRSRPLHRNPSGFAYIRLVRDVL